MFFDVKLWDLNKEVCSENQIHSKFLPVTSIAPTCSHLTPDNNPFDKMLGKMSRNGGDRRAVVEKA